MPTEGYLVIAIIAFTAFYFVVPLVVGAYVRYRGARVVICPETREPAGVNVDAGHAAATASFGVPELRLKSCSRWPERAGCGQECLLQIEISPEDCLVRNMLKSWYADKTCVLCGKPFGDIHLTDHKPALMNAEGLTIEWRDVHPELLPKMLATHKPVCWDCHNMQTLIREHPGLVFERPPREVHLANK